MSTRKRPRSSKTGDDIRALKKRAAQQEECTIDMDVNIGDFIETLNRWPSLSERDKAKVVYQLRGLNRASVNLHNLILEIMTKTVTWLKKPSQLPSSQVSTDAPAENESQAAPESPVYDPLDESQASPGSPVYGPLDESQVHGSVGSLVDRFVDPTINTL